MKAEAEETKQKVTQSEEQSRGLRLKEDHRELVESGTKEKDEVPPEEPRNDNRHNP